MAGTDDVVGEWVFVERGGDLRPVEVDRSSGGAAPTVSTKSAGSVRRTSATLRASVDPGGASAVEVQFRWAEAGEPPTNRTGGRTVNSAGAVSATIDDLDPNTVYEFWVEGSTGGYEIAGVVETFRTGG